MASSCVRPPIAFSGDSHVKARRLSSTTNLCPTRKTSALAIQTKSNRFSVSAEYRDGSKGGGSGSSDFVTGFLLGSAVFGTLACIFAPHIRRSVLNENEYGFKKPEQPMYYDQGLEELVCIYQERREILNEKIGQLNSAIDNVSSRLRGRGSGSSGKSSASPSVPFETDPEAEATA